MRRRFHQLPGVLVAILMIVATVPAPAASIAASQPQLGRQFDGDSYQSPQYGYTVEWSDAWAARERDASSEPGGVDRMVLSNNDGLLQVIGASSDGDLADFLETTVEAMLGDGAEIVASDLQAETPSIEAISGSQHYLVEGYDAGDANVLVMLRARESDYQNALAGAQAGITLNGTAVLSGEPVPPASAPEDVATEEPEDDLDPDSGPTGIDGRTFTSPSHDFEVSWSAIWTATEVIEPDYEILQLSSLTGTIAIIAGDLYGGDPDACFTGESEYYATEDPSISDWTPAVDEDGEVIEFNDDGIAWGIFTFVYHAEDGDLDLVEYLECRSLEEGESDLIVLITTTPDQFERHIESALEITNTIEMPRGSELDEPIDPPLPDFDAQTGPEETEEPAEEPDEDATPGPEATEEPDTAETPEPEETEEPRREPTGDTGLDGTTFTSPGFDFTLEVPDGWTVEDEVIADGDEHLELTNGTSIVTVRAIESDEENLTRCIGMIEAETEEDPLYADLQLSTTSTGDPFQGADDRGAYALYTYTGEDGDTWAYYVRCEFLVEGESLLIIIQDVPYDDYATERLARRQIQNAIELP